MILASCIGNLYAKPGKGNKNLVTIVSVYTYYPTVVCVRALFTCIKILWHISKWCIKISKKRSDIAPSVNHSRDFMNHCNSNSCMYCIVQISYNWRSNPSWMNFNWNSTAWFIHKNSLWYFCRMVCRTIWYCFKYLLKI